MSKPRYPSVPEVVPTLEGVIESVRALKQGYEYITGQRGTDLAVPRVYLSATTPIAVGPGDLWIQTRFDSDPENSRLYYWNGSDWLKTN